MSLKYRNRYLGSKPQKDTSIRVDQQKWLATGLEKHRSHSNYLMDELSDAAGEAEIAAAAAVSTEWCGKDGTAEEGNRYLQVINNVGGTPTAIWFLLPGNTPVSAPDAANIEKCCCEDEIVAAANAPTAGAGATYNSETQSYTLTTEGLLNGDGEDGSADATLIVYDKYQFIYGGAILGDIFEVSGVPGEANVAISWVNSLITDLVDRASIQAEISGGINSYQINKFAINAIAKKYWPSETAGIPHKVGSDWLLRRTVEDYLDAVTSEALIGSIALRKTKERYNQPNDMAVFNHSGGEFAMAVADTNNSRLAIHFHVGVPGITLGENNGLAKTMANFGSNVLCVQADSETVNNFPVFYCLLDNGEIHKVERNASDDYLIEANNWDTSLVISMNSSSTYFAIDPVRRGSGSTPIFFVGTTGAFGLIQVAQDTGGGYGAGSLEDSGSILDSTGDAEEVRGITIHDGDLYYVLKGTFAATAVVRAELTGASISTPGDWTHTFVAGSLTVADDLEGTGDVARFDGAVGIVATETLANGGPVLIVGDGGNYKLKRLAPDLAALSLPQNWSVTDYAGDGTTPFVEDYALSQSAGQPAHLAYYAAIQRVFYAEKTKNIVVNVPDDSGVAGLRRVNSGNQDLPAGVGEGIWW